jgi:hypothetical protein
LHARYDPGTDQKAGQEACEESQYSHLDNQKDELFCSVDCLAAAGFAFVIVRVWLAAAIGPLTAPNAKSIVVIHVFLQFTRRGDIQNCFGSV